MRGTGAEPPAGEDVVSLGRGLGLARLQSPADKWPSRFEEDWGVKFRGYDLDESNRPAFRYAFGAIEIEDKLRKEDGPSNALVREILVQVPEGQKAEQLYLRVASGKSLSKTEQGYSLNNALNIKSSRNERLVFGNESLLLNLEGLLPGPHHFSISYTWPQK